MGRRRKTEPRTCEACNGTFYKPLSHIKKWPARTCSRKCAAVFRLKASERLCQQCGSSFLARKSQTKQGFGKFCSIACTAKHNDKKKEVRCRLCSKPTLVPPHIVTTRKKHFCSKDCRIGWLKRFGTKKGANTFSIEQKTRLLKPKCENCGSAESLELDHIIPRFAGGKATDDNAQTLCRTCNREKYWLHDLRKYAPDLSTN